MAVAPELLMAWTAGLLVHRAPNGSRLSVYCVPRMESLDMIADMMVTRVAWPLGEVDRSRE